MCQPRGRLTKKVWWDWTPASPIVKKSCSCPHCCMRDGRKNRHEILHSSTAKTDHPSGHQPQASHQMCLLQHPTALSSCSLEATLHLLGNPSVARSGAFNPEDLYSRHAPQDHWGEQAQPRELLAKTGRRKKHPKGKARSSGAQSLLRNCSKTP